MKKYFKGLTPATFLLTFASLFADISTEMLYPILPIFLTTVLKSPASIVGIIEGIATATQNIVQGFSGYYSDKIQKRKPIALIGYALAALSKPFMGMSVIWPQVLGARFSDRLGTGIRSAPRDALIAGSANDENRGKAFGLEGIGDNLGAFIGPLIAMLLLFSFHENIRYIFFFAFIPGFLAFLLILFVKEKKTKIEVKSKIDLSITKFPRIYWKYILVTLLFGFGNSSNAFLILQARQIGIPLTITIFIYAFFNLAAALVSFPAGTLSDKFGRKNILLLSFVISAIVYLGFSYSHSYVFIGFLFILYGVYSGIFRAVGKAMATDFVPINLRASGIGWYSSAVGLSGLFASLIGGQLWVKYSSQATFLFGFVFAIIGIFALYLLIPKDGKKLLNF